LVETVPKRNTASETPGILSCKAAVVFIAIAEVPLAYGKSAQKVVLKRFKCPMDSAEWRLVNNLHWRRSRATAF
jgi:hypothetical protein